MKFSKHKLGDLGKIITGKTPSTSNLALWNGDIQFVTPEDLQRGKNILQTERHLTQEGVKSVCGAFIPAESVCVSCIGNIGYVAKTIYPCVTNQQINTIVPSNEQSPDFLYYKLKSIRNYFKLREGNATTIPILSKSDFSNIEIHLPDLPTQLRIAAIMEWFIFRGYGGWGQPPSPRGDNGRARVLTRRNINHAIQVHS